MNRKRDETRTKSNFLRRRRIARAAEDASNARKDPERRAADPAAPRRNRGRV